jgi:hypothetical protein
MSVTYFGSARFFAPFRVGVTEEPTYITNKKRESLRDSLFSCFVHILEA